MSTETTPDETAPATPTTERRHFALLGETTYSPYRNVTRLGHIVSIDPTAHDSERDIIEAAAEKALETMPESRDELVDDELQVIEVDDSPEWVALDDF